MKVQKKLIWAGALILVCALAFGVVSYKKQSNEKNAILKNRIIAGKLIIQGKPLPDDLEKQINLDLLRKDAEQGNPYATQILARFNHKQVANELIQLGKPSPDETAENFDQGMLQADADAGNENAQQLLALLSNRSQLKSSVQLGKPINLQSLNGLDLDLLKKDAKAGNSEIKQALDLIKNRKKSTQLCVLGKPFDYNFYKQVNRDVLRQDATAGYAPAAEILKLADNRIAAKAQNVENWHFPKDYFEHVDEAYLSKDAKAGNPDSQLHWGAAHAKESGLHDDINIELKYINLAVNQNQREAQFYLAYLHSTGIRVKYDQKKAFDLYLKAAKQGHLLAQNNLALAYANGRGVTKNNNLFKQWITKSAKGDCPPAIRILAEAIYRGQSGYKPNINEAEKWYKRYMLIVPNNGIKPDNKNVSRQLYYYQELLIKKYGRKEGQKKIAQCYKLFAQVGHGYSMNEYGLRVLRGHGTQQNEKEGLEWLQKAADANFPDGLEELATLYRNGQHVKKNTKTAKKLYKEAAEKGSRLAILKLYYIYHNGLLGEKKDPTLAFKYAKMGADRREALCTRALAYFYLDGESVEQDGAKGIRLLEQASYIGEKVTCYNDLGIALCQGKGGITPDPVRGVDYFKKAIELGSKYSPYHLANVYLDEANHIKNNKEGIRLLKLASTRKHATSTIMLGEIYEKGSNGQKQDLKKALEFYQTAAALRPRQSTPTLITKAKAHVKRLQTKMKKNQ